MILLLSAAWAIVVAGLIVRAVIQFRGYESLEPKAGERATERCAVDKRTADAPRVLVIVPARNEGNNIGRCLSGLLAQDYPRDGLQIAVVDDHSTDDTPRVVERFVFTDDRCRLLRGQPLPAGWTGKSFACWQAALGQNADWLCFVDADTSAAAGLISAAVAYAGANNLDLLSVEPFQRLGSFWERTIIPAGMLLLAFSQDLRRVNDPADPAAAANGQFLLFRRGAYEAIGGHAAVRSEVCEDTALARLIKRSGRRMRLVGGERFISTRMYTGLRTLWEGLSKNLTETMGGSGKTLALAACALVLGWATPLVPLVAVLHAAYSGGAAAIAAGVLAVCGSAALVGMHIGTARHLRVAWWYGLLLPLAYTLGSALACHAVWQRWHGQVAWKGRTYDAAPSPRHSTDSAATAGGHSAWPPAAAK